MSEAFFVLSGTMKLYDGQTGSRATKVISATFYPVACTASAMGPTSRHRS
jgi:hypothetical protein